VATSWAQSIGGDWAKPYYFPSPTLSETLPNPHIDTESPHQLLPLSREVADRPTGRMRQMQVRPLLLQGVSEGRLALPQDGVQGELKRAGG
jgi:hypothetical protein